MPIDKELLDILACPACKTPVEMTADQDGLRCNDCRRIYPIRGDIPVMMLDQASVEGEDPAEGDED
jgi:uncharacterized protein YbaR (Trm112 family)